MVRAIIENGSRCVNDSGFAARAVAGVKAENDLFREGRLHQEAAQVFRKNGNSLFFRFTEKIAADFSVHLRENKAFVAVRGRSHENLSVW